MAGKPPRPPKDWTPPPHQAPAAAAPPVSTAAAPDCGLKPDRPGGRLRTGPAAPFCHLSADTHVLADHPLSDRPDAPAGDGHRQRDAGFVFRRWPAATDTAAALRALRAAGGRRRGHTRHRRRVQPARCRCRCRWTQNWRGCCRCCAMRSRLGVPVSVDTCKPAGDAGGAGPGRRHHQRHRALRCGPARARRDGGGRSPAVAACA